MRIGWDGKSTFVEGKKVPDCKRIDGSTYASVWAIAETVGTKVYWNGKENKVSIQLKKSNGDVHKISFLRHEINRKVTYKNNASSLLEVG
ncbi:stalk domain-containing protein [Paenibacillus sp. MER TA 81-3]|uniref:stalk domain-containing protein n=1 Tax=Paenibacillus sp. MER TA 81-3 TaxID=2939573 RepID=UPI0034D97B58